jgi:hypothetical protein
MKGLDPHEREVVSVVADGAGTATAARTRFLLSSAKASSASRNVPCPFSEACVAFLGTVKAGDGMACPEDETFATRFLKEV